MGSQPFLTVAISPQLGTCHKKYAPALKPALSIFRSLDVMHDGQDPLAMFIHIFQPGLGRFAVMHAIDIPVFFDHQVMLKIK
jgi:hypothetical protein